MGKLEVVPSAWFAYSESGPASSREAGYQDSRNEVWVAADSTAHEPVLSICLQLLSVEVPYIRGHRSKQNPTLGKEIP